MEISAILMDIEGTAAPIAFVRDVLFPYARARLPAFLAAHAQAAVLAEVPEPRLETLLGWMDRDEKATALKAVQGMIWRAGYEAGDIKSELYPDVGPALRRWARAGLRLFVYSSGSVEAQKLLFRYSEDGDFEPLFQGFFDTRLGPKRDPASYAAIARGANVTPAACLFLSDVEAELDAAAAAGLLTCQLVRPRDGTRPGERHAAAADFSDVADRFRLPHG